MLKSKSVRKGTAASNGALGAPAQDLAMRVAFQGARGAYAEGAIARIWRHPVELVPVPTFTGAVRSINVVSPHWPLKFPPHDQTLPSFRKASM